MTPLSLVAAVIPLTVPVEPVLWATMVPGGSSPFSRVGKVFVDFRLLIKKLVDALDSSSPRKRRASRRAVSFGVPVSRGSVK